jgi:hypothetical protein
MIADRISRAAVLGLVRVGPALIQRAVPWEASLAKTLLGTVSVGYRIDPDAYIGVAAFNYTETKSRPTLAGVLAVAEFKQSLGLPLAGSAPLCVSGKTHTEVFVRSDDGVHLLGSNVDGLGALEHLEVAGNLVKGELLGEGAVIPDVDVESALRAACNKSVVDWSRCGHQGEQRGEGEACSVHVEVKTVVVLRRCVSFRDGSRPCNDMLMLTERRYSEKLLSSFVLCPLSNAKDPPKSEDNGTMETPTFIAQVDGELPGVKAGVQATETSRTREIWYRRSSNVHCDQVTSVTGESSVEIEGGLMRVLSSLDLSEILYSMMRRAWSVTCKIYKPRPVLYLQCVRLVCEN